MTPLTEDELARPLTAEEEAQWRSWLAAGHMPFGSDAIQGDRIRRLFATLDALRDTPVADTAGIDAGEKAAREFVESISGPLDLAWAEAEAALPVGWSFWQMTGYRRLWDEKPIVFARVRLANVIYTDGSVPEVSGSGPTPAAALLALAAALRTPKPEGEPE